MRRMVVPKNPLDNAIIFGNGNGVNVPYVIQKTDLVNGNFKRYMPYLNIDEGLMMDIPKSYVIKLDTSTPTILKVSAMDIIQFGMNQYGGLVITYYDTEGSAVTKKVEHGEFTTITFETDGDSSTYLEFILVLDVL